MTVYKVGSDLLDQIDYQFKDKQLIIRALTHRSASKKNNERLEFLGDAVLSLVVADLLHDRFKSGSEGQLSRLRSNIVKGETLAKVARTLELGNHLVLGEGERRNAGNQRESILAGAVEAVIGAIYVDGGIKPCYSLIKLWFGEYLDALSLDKVDKDPKSVLQEYLQSKGYPVPEYVVDSTEGKEHLMTFHVSCVVDSFDGKYSGSGSSRKKAEQEAASQALKQIK